MSMKKTFESLDWSQVSITDVKDERALDETVTIAYEGFKNLSARISGVYRELK